MVREKLGKIMTNQILLLFNIFIIIIIIIIIIIREN